MQRVLLHSPYIFQYRNILQSSMRSLMHSYFGLMVMKTIVVEFGSVYIRGGFANETSPRFITESLNILNINDSQRLTIKLVDLFQRIFVEKLVVKPKDYSILIIEKLSFSRLFRDTLLTILFREFQVRICYLTSHNFIL